jgi:hypothetical protein
MRELMSDDLPVDEDDLASLSIALSFVFKVDYCITAVILCKRLAKMTNRMLSERTEN